MSILEAPTEYVSIPEAAHIANVHADTVRRAIYTRELEAYKVGRVIRIPRAALNEFLTSSPVVPVAGDAA